MWLIAEQAMDGCSREPGAARDSFAGQVRQAEVRSPKAPHFSSTRVRKIFGRGGIAQGRCGERARDQARDGFTHDLGRDRVVQMLCTVQEIVRDVERQPAFRLLLRRDELRSLPIWQPAL